MSHKLRKV